MKLIDAFVCVNYATSYKISNLSGCSIRKHNGSYDLISPEGLYILNNHDIEFCLREMSKRFPSEFMDDKWHLDM